MQRNGRLKKLIQKSLIVGGSAAIADEVRDLLRAYWTGNLSYSKSIKSYTTSSLDSENIESEKIKLSFENVGSINENIYNSIFEDYSFQQILPYGKNYPYTIVQQPNTSKIDISSHSDVVSTVYENYKNDPNNLPKSLNYYVGLGRDIKNNPDIEALVTLKGAIDDGILGYLAADGKYPQAGNYFDAYADKASSFSWGGYDSKLKNIVLDGKTAKLYASPFALKEAFNSYIQLDLYKEKSQEISNALSETDLNLKLISDLYIDKKYDFTGALEFVSSEQYLKFVGNNTNITNNLVELSTRKATEAIRFYDITNWAMSNIGAANSISDPDAGTFFNFKNKNALIVGSNINLDKELTRDNPFLVKLYSRLFYSKLLKLRKDKYFRTFDEILKGKLCHTEVVGFRIDKSLDNKGGGIFNSTYIENNDTEILNFIDTQINNKINYLYKVYYYVAVYGNEYKYQSDTPDSVIVFNTPTVKIFEIAASNLPQADPRQVPEIQEPVLEYPPNTPIIEPVPYFDYRYRTQLKFNFQKVIDNMTVGIPYFGILPEDQSTIEAVSDSQKKKYAEAEKTPPLIRFRTSSTNNVTNKHVYQIFKTTKEPTSYADFKEVYATVGSTEQEIDSFIDNLEPNVDYYYTFRAVDASTNLFSNPTIVYVIRMVKDSDIYYPVIRTLDLQDLEEDRLKKCLDGQKTFKKYLQIKPNLSALTLTNNKIIGQISGKNIIVRITSKKTNRKIDIRFMYNLDGTIKPKQLMPKPGVKVVR